uniref:(northern house mosquito) hypothetical protein n=1 Tax=Culex pipiens TaxID=7175 RepID=A0A8D8I7T6_CULPI
MFFLQAAIAIFERSTYLDHESCYFILFCCKILTNLESEQFLINLKFSREFPGFPGKFVENFPFPGNFVTPENWTLYFAITNSNFLNDLLTHDFKTSIFY